MSLPRRFVLTLGFLFVAAAAAPAQLAAQAAAPVLQVDGLGKGTAPLEGPWQFHIGDSQAWAAPATADGTGVAGWEQLSPDTTWGAQSHPSYTGYAWYRKHIHFSPAADTAGDFYMLVRNVNDAYEVYWNGQIVGHNGAMPPHPSYRYSQSPQIVHLGQVRDGVLALRVWKAPLTSFDSDALGGLVSVPFAGSLEAITTEKTAEDYQWLRSRQYSFGLQSLYGLVMILSLLAWFRDRSQNVLLAMAVFSGSPVIGMFLVGLRLPIPFNVALGLLQPVISLQDIGLWFLLIYLLKLDDNRNLLYVTRLLAIFSLAATSVDGMLTLQDWSEPLLVSWVQLADASMTAIFTVSQTFPFVVLAFALRKRLDPARWAVAIAALLTEMIFVVRIAAQQGSRFTHWTLGNRIGEPLFYFAGNAFTAQMLTDTLMLLAIIFAVYRFMRESSIRQGGMEQELRSARELQRVLIPDRLPDVPGFALTSAYRPAQDVGGDFFLIIPLEGELAGSTMIILGDVSGKGLKAAMTVSLIVGAANALARFLPRPGELLAELNQRLWGRLQGGFTTCLALRLNPEGQCAVASAGHPAPYRNRQELNLPGALPLGIVPGTKYEEVKFELREGDHFALYTDGLLEARRSNGEIFSFERLDELFASRPGAAEATNAAVDFGQDDDITVLTLTRLTTGERPTTKLTLHTFATAWRS